MPRKKTTNCIQCSSPDMAPSRRLCRECQRVKWRQQYQDGIDRKRENARQYYIRKKTDDPTYFLRKNRAYVDANRDLVKAQKARNYQSRREDELASKRAQYWQDPDFFRAKARRYRKCNAASINERRRTKHRLNPERKRSQARRYYAQNIDRMRDRGRQYYAENRDAIIGKKLIRYWSNPSIYRARSRRYYRLNSERIAQRRSGNHGPTVYSLQDEFRPYAPSRIEKEDVIDICASLDGEQREVINALLVTGADLNAAAEMTGVSVGDVRALLGWIRETHSE